MVDERCRNKLKEWIGEYKNNGNPIVLGIEKKDREKLIGIVGWIFYNKKEDVELIIRISSEEWGKGYGTRIIQAMISYSFNNFKSSNVLGITHHKNIGMRQVFRKNGFSQELIKTDKSAFFYKLKKEEYNRGIKL